VIQVSPPIPREDVARALEEVLARGELRERTSLIEEFVRWLAERVHLSLAPGAAEVLLWSLVGLGSVLLVFLLARFLQAGRSVRSERDEDVESAGADVAGRVEALFHEARAARERGELALALRRFLHALVLGLGGRGALEFREAWTNRELLAHGKPSADALAVLAPLVRELEAKEYGGRATTAEDVERLEALCERFLAPRAPRSA